MDADSGRAEEAALNCRFGVIDLDHIDLGLDLKLDGDPLTSARAAS